MVTARSGFAAFFVSVLTFFCSQSATATYTKPIQLHGLNYVPTKGAWHLPSHQRCKTREEILQDLRKISAITNRVRIYSLVDCKQGRTMVSVAAELGMKVWLGLWIGKDPGNFRSEFRYLKSMLHDGLLSDGTVIGVHVGSEALAANLAPLDRILANRREVGELFYANGLGPVIPVSITDIASKYIQHPKLAVDSNNICVNVFSFWHPRANPDDNLHGLINHIKSSAGAQQHKKIVITEIGWASGGYNAKAGVASGENQAKFFKKFYCAIAVGKQSWSYYYFIALDSRWLAKDGGKENDVEGYFGMFYENGEMKPHLKSLEFKCPGDDSTIYSMPEAMKRRALGVNDTIV